MPHTHEVTNQPPPLAGYDASEDPALLDALRREGADWAEPELRQLGRLAGGEKAQENGRLANDHPPKLRTHDRYGHRVDEVEFHPAWHELMATAVYHGLHATPWRERRPGAHVARAAGLYVWGQAEAGHLCPVSMTYAIVPALRHAPELARQFEPLLAATHYDFGLRPPLAKSGLLAGMSMTEKQGGSDVRTNTTTAVRQSDGTYRITGHKWFTSAPMGDLFMVLAQTTGTGLSCFLLPRVLPDGTRNGMRLMRLKDKLGNRSNASAEVEYEDATAWLVGEEGRGVQTIIEMVNSTRLDCVLAAATSMRLGVIHAAHHAKYRTAFGKALIDQPLMANVLADLAVESEAATTVAMRLAAATDRAAHGDENEAAFRRLALAVTKYWVCKQAPGHAAEALECLGGNGYVEESGMPRLYREAPLGSIWEGSGNVAALDALRALTRQPQSAQAFFTELDLAAGADRRLDEAVARLRKEAADPSEHAARRLAEAMAVTLQAALLIRHGHPAVADAFAATRLAGDRGHAYGTLPAGVRTSDITARATPASLSPERKRHPPHRPALSPRFPALAGPSPLSRRSWSHTPASTEPPDRSVDFVRAALTGATAICRSLSTSGDPGGDIAPLIDCRQVNKGPDVSLAQPGLRGDKAGRPPYFRNVSPHTPLPLPRRARHDNNLCARKLFGFCPQVSAMITFARRNGQCCHVRTASNVCAYVV